MQNLSYVNFETVITHNINEIFVNSIYPLFSSRCLDQKKFQCIDLCQVNYVNLKCSGNRRRRFRHIIGKHRTLIQAEFELQVQPQPASGTMIIFIDLDN